MGDDSNKELGTFGVRFTPPEYAATRLEGERQLRGPAPTAACWTDLLGFSQQLANCGWKLDPDNLRIPVSRLVQLAHETRGRANPFEEAVFVNDAVIRTCHPQTYAAPLSERHNFLAWLEACIVAHCNVTGLEQDYSLPGLRTVICEGQMVTYLDQSDPVSNSIASRWVHHLSTLQLNTALSKCYLADSLGSSVGLKKGGLYLDDQIIQTLVTQFECTFHGPDMLFLYGFPLLKPVDLYTKRKNLVRISATRARPSEPFQDQSSWITLGESIVVEHRDLTFTLREVLAFSPGDEFSLMWYDTFRGDMHGYLVSDLIPLRSDGRPLYPELAAGSFSADEVISEFLAGYTRYADANPELPWDRKPHMQRRSFRYERVVPP